MKTRLNLTIEENVVAAVKAYASKKRISISELVEDYFKSLSTREARENIVDLMKTMPIPQLPEDIDYRKDYYKDRSSKYGF